MTTTIKNRYSGTVIYTHDGDSLRAAAVAAVAAGVSLTGANLREADLCGAILTRVDLREANLRGADLRGADLAGADLREADLCGAILRWANLREAILRWANLREAVLIDATLPDATLPDGRTLEQWQADPLAGLCTDPEAVAKATAAWGNHTWQDCPLHEGLGVSSIDEVEAGRRLLAATFVALFDGRHLPKPTPGTETD